ncbi:MAG: DUF4249 domain-containing protein [Chryseotalea sp.]
MKNIVIKSLFAFAILTSLFACEDTVDVKLENAEPLLVVDAFITNRSEPQVIKLMRTQPYFATELPPTLSGATVTVTDSEGRVYTFTETTPGNYTWTPAANETFGEVGLQYTLEIETNGETYEALADMSRVPEIDSLTFFFEPGDQFTDDFVLAEFWSTDPDESGDAYWIKTYKNGQLLNKPVDINLAYDAGFSRGSNFNGVPFIVPIRRAINSFDEDPNDDTKVLPPLVLGDSLYVEINSLSEDAFDFLTELKIQTDRPGGFGELFATPLANVSTNIKNTNPNGTKAVGFFNVAAVSGFGRKYKSTTEVKDFPK